MLDKILSKRFFFYLQLINYYQKLIELSGLILLNNFEESKKGMRELVVRFVKYISQNYRQELEFLLTQTSKEIADQINMCLVE